MQDSTEGTSPYRCPSTCCLGLCRHCYDHRVPHRARARLSRAHTAFVYQPCCFAKVPLDLIIGDLIVKRWCTWCTGDVKRLTLPDDHGQGTLGHTFDSSLTAVRKCQPVDAPVAPVHHTHRCTVCHDTTRKQSTNFMGTVTTTVSPTIVVASAGMVPALARPWPGAGTWQSGLRQCSHSHYMYLT